ncbi:nodulation protein NodH [Roseibacterium sp. SDUM158017]|uniref:nodulation protein NodH n=1 Tax=Roseicyclus salinarum TaxID=3036773 RepID=UPI0024156F23|nr:nodulation protein NodH [Roseibacterium sp. SDUM158017]MDG4646984.1 nodulation protein NodH [Roseibacterium sp. SDUM158017]
MTRPFDAFVIFAEMRTGSNHLEESLNSLPDVTCHGEVFNPVFIGRKDRFELLGHDLAARERDPMSLLRAMIADAKGLAGFRFFHDHDPRVLAPVIADARIAKVILTRNPLDAYVSRKIAAETGQWRLTDLKDARTSRIRFDADEFAAMLGDWTAFHDQVSNGLQRAGQGAFHIRFEDINDLEVLNGLAQFLGSEHRLSRASGRLKRQNPAPLEDKVENHDEMVAALGRMERFGLDRIVETEAPRAPGVPGFVAHPDAGLLFLPVSGAPRSGVLDWMAAIGDVGRNGLLRGMSQKDLRKWMRGHPGFTSFTVLRHPAPRAFGAYLRLLSPAMVATREVLRGRYGVPFPADEGGPHRDAFLRFLAFLKGNIAGQTSLRTEADWATQTAILQRAAHAVLPQMVLKEAEAPQALAGLAARSGLDAPPMSAGEGRARSLSAIWDDGVERAVFDAYRRDFVQLGFGPWSRP